MHKVKAIYKVTRKTREMKHKNSCDIRVELMVVLYKLSQKAGFPHFTSLLSARQGFLHCIPKRYLSLPGTKYLSVVVLRKSYALLSLVLHIIPLRLF